MNRRTLLTVAWAWFWPTAPQRAKPEPIKTVSRNRYAYRRPPGIFIGTNTTATGQYNTAIGCKALK